MKFIAFLICSMLVLACGQAAAQNRALELNGTSDYAFTVITSGFNPNELTAECWIRPGAVPTGGPMRDQRVMVKGSETFQTLLDGRFALDYIEDGTLGAASGTVRFKVYLGSFIPGDMVQLDSLLTYGAEQWIHIAGTFSGITGLAEIYVNGFLENSTTMSMNGVSLLGQTMTSSPQPLAFGAVPFASALPSTAFRGQIDAARVWNVVRTPTEIAGNMLTELTTGTGLIDAWNMNGTVNGVTFMGLNLGSASFPITFTPGVGGGGFPPVSECQLAQAEATLGVGGSPGNGSAPAFTNALTGSVSLNSTLVGNVWDVALTPSAFAVPLSGSGFQTIDSQIVNIDIVTPTFGWLQGGLFQAPFPGPVNVGFTGVAGSLISGQMVVADPTASSGLRLSNPGIVAPGL